MPRKYLLHLFASREAVLVAELLRSGTSGRLIRNDFQRSKK